MGPLSIHLFDVTHVKQIFDRIEIVWVRSTKIM